LLTAFPALKRVAQIQLSNVPPTATPADLRRLITRAQVPGVEQVAIEYFHLEPTGSAYLQLTHPDFLQSNLDALEKVTISGLHPIAEPSYRRTMDLQLQGHGLSSELDCNGKSVAIWVFPKKMQPARLADFLVGFNFPPGEPYIFQIPMSVPYTTVSRFLVRLASVSEAHRLVRELHMTQFKPEEHGTRYSLRARVIY